MNRALWLLLGLQLRGWGRIVRRSLGTPRGALLALLGLLVFVFWMGMLVLAPNQAPRLDGDVVRRYFPAFLLFYCFMSLALSRGESGLHFGPAEVQFLFSAPFTRRQLIAFKVVQGVVLSLPSTLILALVLSPHASWFVACYLALVLSLVFLQHFTMALYLVAQTVGAAAYTRGRVLTLAGLVLAALGVVGHALWRARPTSVMELADAVHGEPVWQVLRTPLTWFAEAFLADNGLDLLRYGGLALLVDGMLLALVFVLDAQYLEAAAVRSEKVYAQLQRFRRGEAVSLRWVESSGSTRLRLPPLPGWGGIGPVIWRQALTAVRSAGRLGMAGMVLVPMLVGPFLVSSQNKDTDELVPAFAGLIVWTSVLLSSMLPFDFRGDLDRMDVLKGLPISAWRMAVGQLVVPVVLLSVVQFGVLALIQAVLRPSPEVVLAVVLFVVPFNGLVFALDNLLFLLFPGRLAVTPGDFQAIGRNVLFLVAKLAVMGSVAGVAMGSGLLVFVVTGKNAAMSVGVAWLVVTGAALLLVPLVALAWRRFDVVRDVPVE